MAAVPMVIPALTTDSGSPVSGALIYFKRKGTNTDQAAYLDDGLTTPCQNPEPCDAGGRQVVYLDGSQSYDVTVKTANAATTLFSVTFNANNDNVDLGTGWADVLELPAAGILDNLSGVRFVATYAALTALTAATGLSDGAVYCTYTRAGTVVSLDGGYGLWAYSSSSTATANGGTILAVDGGGAGRFFRLIKSDGDWSLAWFLTGDGSTNEATQLQAAITALSAAGGGVLVNPTTHQIRYDSNITVSKGVFLEGAYGFLDAREAEEYTAFGSTFLPASDAQLQFAEGSGMRGCIVRPHGMTFPQTGTQAATWTGVPVYISAGGHGVAIERCHIFGFERAIDGDVSSSEDVRIFDNQIDARNGIRIRGATNWPWIVGNSFWPMASVGLTGVSDADLVRPGTGILMDGSGAVIDGTRVLNNFVFGYNVGYDVYDANDTFLSDNDYDAVWTPVAGYYFTGFRVRGDSIQTVIQRANTYNAFRSFSVEVVQTGHKVLMQGITAHASRDQIIYAEHGVTQISGFQTRGVIWGWASNYLSAASVGTAGTGYVVGDTLTLAGGTSAGQTAKVRVSSVDGSGGITGLTIVQQGAYSANPSSPNSATGGTGTGAAITCTFSALATATTHAVLVSGTNAVVTLDDAQINGCTNALSFTSSATAAQVAWGNNIVYGATGANAVNGSNPTIASASTITPAPFLHYIDVSGTTTINTITATNRSQGEYLFIRATDAWSLAHGGGNISTANGQNIVMASGDRLLLCWSGVGGTWDVISHWAVNPTVQGSSLVTFKTGAVTAFSANTVALRLNSYTVGTLPTSGAQVQNLTYVSNETGGGTIAFYDGANWLRAQDRAVCS